MKRVVVTGIGAVTPIGNDVESMWKNLIKGKHGIDVIDRFDIDGFENHLAAEVKGYDPLLYMSRKDVNRYDPYTVFGVGAACQAMENSKIDGTVPKEIWRIFQFGYGRSVRCGKRNSSANGKGKFKSFVIYCTCNDNKYSGRGNSYEIWMQSFMYVDFNGMCKFVKCCGRKHTGASNTDMRML